MITKLGRLIEIWKSQVPEGFETVPRLSLAPTHGDFMTQLRDEFGEDSEMLIQAAYKGLLQRLSFDIVKQGPGKVHEISSWNRGWGVLEVKRWGVGTEFAEMLFEQMSVAWIELRRWQYESSQEKGSLKESGMIAQRYVAICQHIRTRHKIGRASCRERVF